MITLGNGKLASFWLSPWITIPNLATLFPGLFKRSKGKNKCVADALAADSWVQDIRLRSNDGLVHSFLVLWRALRTVNPVLHPHIEDRITWCIQNTGTYSAKSAYKLQFKDCMKTDNKQLI